jgi:hypothetical protein
MIAGIGCTWLLPPPWATDTSDLGVRIFVVTAAYDEIAGWYEQEFLARTVRS